MFLVLPNGKKEFIKIPKTYKEKLQLVNSILEQWSDYLYDSWSSNSVKSLLSGCAYILTCGGDQQETFIITHNKEKYIINKEIPLSSCDSLTNDVFYSIDEESEEYNVGQKNIQSKSTQFNKVPPRHGNRYFNKNSKKFRHLRNLSDDFIYDVRISTQKHFNNCQNLLHKLQDIDNHLCLTVKKKYFNPDNENNINMFCREVLHRYLKLKLDFSIPTKTIQQKNNLLKIAKLSYMNLLTRIDKINLIRKYLINSSLPYSSSWQVVDSENIFEYGGNKYKINSYYGFDKILVYKQEDKMFWFDGKINRLKQIQQII